MDSPKPKHDHHPLRFPKGFLWGAATSAFQVEGNNTTSDWWEWEQKNQPEDFRSGLAADHYNRFEEDFKLAKELGHNAHRLSLEWSRIEPEEGVWNLEAIEHYKTVLRSLKEKDIKVMLTLWHFTLPLWLAKKGGWENNKAVYYFERFVKKIVPELKEEVDFWITLNEPTVYLYHHYIDPLWPGARKAWFGKQFQTFLTLVAAHKKAYKVIHSLSNKPVGIAHNVQSIAPYHMHSLVELFSVYLGDLVSNHAFYMFTKGYHDFFGLNYYFHKRIEGFPSAKKLTPELNREKQAHEVSDLGWEIYPEGIFEVLVDLGNHIPIYITECGIASTNDDRRTRFLILYLQSIYRAIHSGINIKGFFYWSLLDNLEWHLGFNPRFGLVEVDFKTQKRTPRPSSFVYRKIIRNNGIPHKMLRLLGHGFKVEAMINIKD